MPRGRPPKKPKLPAHVFIKKDTGHWFARRNFRTYEKYANGQPVYTQLVRRCDPHTEERSREVYEEIGELHGEFDQEITREDTVETYLDAFLDTKAGTIAVRTLEGYRSIYGTYIKGKSLGRTPLADVRAFTVQSYYTDLQARGVSPKMVRKLHTLLSMAFSRAVLWERMTKNPCARGSIMLPKADDPEIEFYDREEARRFMKVCLAEPEKYLVLAVALDSAMRPGEHLGLRWKDVDFRHGRVRVRKVVSFLRSGEFLIKDPKTKRSRRSIELSPRIMDELSKHRARLDAAVADAETRAKAPLTVDHINARKGSVRYEDRRTRRAVAKQYLKSIETFDLVFPSEHGTPIDASNLGKRDMKEACAKAKVKKIGLYGLRHSWATLALEAGVDLKAVAERLGDDEVTVLKHYAHVLPSMRQKAYDVMADALY